MLANGIQPVPRMDLNFTLFKGASFRIDGSKVQEHTQVSMISAMPAVKQMWPLRNYSIPNTQRKNIMYNPNATITRLDDTLSDPDSYAEDKTKDTFSTHVMTQVDKLHAEGSMFIPVPAQLPSPLSHFPRTICDDTLALLPC